MKTASTEREAIVAEDLFLRALAAYHTAPSANLGEGRAAAGAVIDAALKEVEQLARAVR